MTDIERPAPTTRSSPISRVPKRRRIGEALPIPKKLRYSAIKQEEPCKFVELQDAVLPKSPSALINSFLLSCDREMETDAEPRTRQQGAYGHGWYVCSRSKEMGGAIPAWNAPPTDQVDKARLDVIRNYYMIAQKSHLSTFTIELSVGNFDKILAHRTAAGLKWTQHAWCHAAVGAFRLALKFEEQPETLWDFPGIWSAFSSFSQWKVDQSEAALQSAECEILRVIEESIDAPLPSQFFDRFLTVGGWPAEMRRQYAGLGFYLLALCHFAPIRSTYQLGSASSKVAAAALVLAVKIINADSRKTYEFYPQRLQAYTSYSLQDIQPHIRLLSHMLRDKPPEAEVLKTVHPQWGENEWA